MAFSILKMEGVMKLVGKVGKNRFCGPLPLHPRTRTQASCQQLYKSPKANKKKQILIFALLYAHRIVFFLK